ncbi:MAG: UDP-glucose 4-epimerase GalE [Clostridiales bacterium]|nr:UDP-glucose 4-epimerase GalE [Clostridiales bacterium]
MAVLVCGGAGYVGSHTVTELILRGYDAIVVDSLETGHRESVWPGAKFYEGDLRDDFFMEKVFRENKITSVIDFAAFSLVGESVLNPMKYYENNFYGALCLLKQMLKMDVRHIVFSSTAATYGNPVSIPILETDPTEPINPYGETKLAVEKAFKWYDSAYGLKYAALRYFNVAGAHPSGKIGEDHRPETHLIPNVLRVAMGLDPAVKLFGGDYPTEDGTCVRDYIHATDLADAHILAMEKLVADDCSSIYNLGNGKGFSNKQIIEMAKDVTGKRIPVEMAPRRHGDPPVLVASSEKISRQLKWKPKFNTLDQIIQTAWQWHAAHPNGYGGK